MTTKQRESVRRREHGAQPEASLPRSVEPIPECAKPEKALIGQRLIHAGLVTESHIAEALRIQREQGGRIADILIGMGCLTTDAFVEFLAKQPGVASIELSNYCVSPDVVSLVPEEFAVARQVFPLDRMGRLLTLGMTCPLDTRTIREVEQQTGLRVKPILCTAHDMKDAILRHYNTGAYARSLGRPMPLATSEAEDRQVCPRIEGVVETVRSIEKLPALPETAERVREMMADPEEPLAKVASVIALDPPVAAKVLGLVNGAAYGIHRRVDNLALAVSLLGVEETYSLVLSCSVVNLLEKSKYFDYRVFWLQSLRGVSAARTIAHATRNAQRFGVVAAGLLHDLGRAALAEAAPQLYCLIDRTLAGPRLLEEEQRVLGITHAEAGYHLAREWGLPIEIAEPIRFHHAPERATEAPENVAIVALAAAMASGAEPSDLDQDEFRMLKPALDALGLGLEKAYDIWEQFQGNNAG